MLRLFDLAWPYLNSKPSQVTRCKVVSHNHNLVFSQTELTLITIIMQPKKKRSLNIIIIGNFGCRVCFSQSGALSFQYCAHRRFLHPLRNTALTPPITPIFPSDCQRPPSTLLRCQITPAWRPPLLIHRSRFAHSGQHFLGCSLLDHSSCCLYKPIWTYSIISVSPSSLRPTLLLRTLRVWLTFLAFVDRAEYGRL